MFFSPFGWFLVSLTHKAPKLRHFGCILAWGKLGYFYAVYCDFWWSLPLLRLWSFGNPDNCSWQGEQNKFDFFTEGFKVRGAFKYITESYCGQTKWETGKQGWVFSTFLLIKSCPPGKSTWGQNKLFFRLFIVNFCANPCLQVKLLRKRMLKSLFMVHFGWRWNPCFRGCPENCWSQLLTDHSWVPPGSNWTRITDTILVTFNCEIQFLPFNHAV